MEVCVCVCVGKAVLRKMIYFIPDERMDVEHKLSGT